MTEKLAQQTLPPAARVFSSLQAEEALLPSGVSALRRTGALFLAILFFAATPLFFAAFAAGVIGDTPAALAKSGTSGPSGSDDDDRLGPSDDEADDITFLKTDDTSANNRETRGTTRDHDTTTRTRGGTNDTSRNGNSTRGTTRDNDTASNTLNSATGTGTGTDS
jgi:hypothetical protein